MYGINIYKRIYLPYIDTNIYSWINNTSSIYPSKRIDFSTYT